MCCVSTAGKDVPGVMCYVSTAGGGGGLFPGQMCYLRTTGVTDCNALSVMYVLCSFTCDQFPHQTSHDDVTSIATLNLIHRLIVKSYLPRANSEHTYPFSLARAKPGETLQSSDVIHLRWNSLFTCRIAQTYLLGSQSCRLIPLTDMSSPYRNRQTVSKYAECRKSASYWARLSCATESDCMRIKTTFRTDEFDKRN